MQFRLTSVPTIKTLPPFSIRANPNLYEINTWSWLERLSAQSGRTLILDDVPDTEWDALAQLGFDTIWLMGVWQRSPVSRQMSLDNPANFPDYDRALPGWKPADVVGSPYAVMQYVPDSRIGTWDSLDRVREKLHARKIALFLDFVGNHSARDNPWVREHPEFYVQGSKQDFERNTSLYFQADTKQGSRYIALAKDPYFPPWIDVAQLNHFQPEMRAAHLAELAAIAKHCDGVRCDMAMLQLNDIFENGWTHLLGNTPQPAKEFWAEAHETLPNLILLAEAYWGTEPRLLDLGFSFAYDKVLYDAVRNADVGAVQSRLSGIGDRQSNYARFLENHDEPRRAEVIPNDHLPAVGTLMGTLPGMRFYQQGELEGCKIRLPITLRVAAGEPSDPYSVAFFRKILSLTREDVFHDGNWSALEVTAEGYTSPAGLLVYEWRSKKAWKIVAVNLAAGASQGRVLLGDRVSPAQQYVFYDELNDVRYDRAGDELHNVGLFVRLEGFQAHIFNITPA
jgi:Alpha amylase, catalytic domain